MLPTFLGVARFDCNEQQNIAEGASIAQKRGDFVFTNPQGVGKKLRGSLKAAAPVVSPVLSAYSSGTGVHSPDHHWRAGLVGYVCTVLPVARAIASSLSILSGTRLSCPTHRSLSGSLSASARSPSQVVLAIQSWALRQVNARAPPSHVTVRSCNSVSSARRSSDSSETFP